MIGTEPASTNLSNALSLIRTCRPTWTNSIRRSAIKRRTNRGPVFKSSPAWSTVRRRSIQFHFLSDDTASGAPTLRLSIPVRVAPIGPSAISTTLSEERPIPLVGELWNCVSARCRSRHAARPQERDPDGRGPGWP